ncbi:EI24 domain-containing protein [Synechococcus sp. Nb3U1]|uniref:EI24 domain-containing protein n=1 Tax=Synechococcus sp. Nb3U1 TaxID=1914529 RepID=UPI001F29A031|nr:EI24 domain-containing protein [Synechococcus sp. Nb3U1]MCF2971380.1 EI24 domain-containing protein [Synechococcus sp. Nb3U1]
MALSHPSPDPHSPALKGSLGIPPTLITQYRRHGGSLYQFWMGIRFFVFGWSLFWRSRHLQLWGALPTLITAATFGGLAFLGAWLTRHGLEVLAVPLWLLGLAQGLVALLIVLGLTYFLFFPLVTLVAGPFREHLAAQTEQRLIGQVKRGELSLGAVLVDVLGLIGLQLVLALIGLGLSWLLPGLGHSIGLGIWIYLAALDMVDPVLGLWGWRLGAKLRFVSEHRALMAGFGLMSALLLAIPLLNLLILPLGTIGATALALAVTQAQLKDS